ncbi:hypothetical protein Tco_1400283 [Tanacetum coccineum]
MASSSISLELWCYKSSCKDMELVPRSPKLKFEKVHVCYAVALGKKFKKPPNPNLRTPIKEKLYLLPYGSMGANTCRDSFQTLSSTPFVPPSRSDWDLLFQPMFDESLNSQPYVDLQAPEVIAPIHEVVAHDMLYQLAHLPQLQLIKMHHLQKLLLFKSSSSDVIHTIVPPDHQVSEHNSKWTKDHPLENIIGALDRPVSTRLQLHEQALFCYYDAFLTSGDYRFLKTVPEHLHKNQSKYALESLKRNTNMAMNLVTQWIIHGGEVQMDED